VAPVTEEDFLVEVAAAISCSSIERESLQVVPLVGHRLQVDVDGHVFNLHIEKIKTPGLPPVEGDRLDGFESKKEE